MKSVILMGSSNSKGNTRMVVDALSELLVSDIVDLGALQISEFDYTFNNKDDDFHPLMEHVVQTYDLIILATPVYWYTMSARMKIFMDRLSDCLKIRKETGRTLRGKQMAVVSCGSDQELKDGFHMPFRETARYLGMAYLGDVHTWVSNRILSKEVTDRLNCFAKQLLDQ